MKCVYCIWILPFGNQAWILTIIIFDRKNIYKARFSSFRPCNWLLKGCLNKFDDSHQLKIIVNNEPSINQLAAGVESAWKPHGFLCCGCRLHRISGMGLDHSGFGQNKAPEASPKPSIFLVKGCKGLVQKTCVEAIFCHFWCNSPPKGHELIWWLGTGAIDSQDPAGTEEAVSWN